VDVVEFKKNISNIMANASLDRMVWGLYFLQFDTNSGSFKPLFTLNERNLFLPASNNKILTTAASLLYWGPNHTITSTISGTIYNVSQGLVPQACFTSSGDPSITYSTVVKLADQVKKSGVNVIDTLLLNDVYPPFPSSWAFDDLKYDYGAQPSGFVLNENIFTVKISPGKKKNDPIIIELVNDYDLNCVSYSNTAFTTDQEESNLIWGYNVGNPVLQFAGYINIHDKPFYLNISSLDYLSRFSCVLKLALSKSGVRVNNVKLGNCQHQDNDIAVVKSPTYSDMMNYTLQVSDNLYAELFLRKLGDNGILSERLGIKKVKQILTTGGVKEDSFYQVDGSGLSRMDLVSPESIINTFLLIEKSPYAAMYKSFLPVGGRSGTLVNRFVGTLAEGRVHAKTGSLTGVNSLSGYVDYGPGFLFSILSNCAQASSSVVRNAIDSMVLALINYCK